MVEELENEGGESQIEKLRALGLLGSTGDPMWNPATKTHECCGSRKAYYHKKDCPLCTKDLDEIDFKATESTNDAGNVVRFNQHRKRRNNDLVAAMYAMYITPDPDTGGKRSLEFVAKCYGRSRQAVYDVFRSRGYQLRSKPVKEFVVVDNIKFTPRSDGYWRATTGDRKQLHVYVWEKHFGKLKPGHGIHHKDLDRSNNSIGNLVCMRIAEISSKHNPHFNQFTSPTGSRKWKRGRIIPRKPDHEISIREAKK